MTASVRCDVVMYDAVCRFLDALFYAVDGNFQANMKEKPHDAEDTPLSKGAGYFADEAAFAAFAETLGPIEPEVNGPIACDFIMLMAYFPAEYMSPVRCHGAGAPLGEGVWNGGLILCETYVRTSGWARGPTERGKVNLDDLFVQHERLS